MNKFSGKRKFKKSASRILEIGGETFAESRFETLSLSWVIALFIGLGGDNNSHLACWVAPSLLYTFSKSSLLFHILAMHSTSFVHFQNTLHFSHILAMHSKIIINMP